jgi:hypothetical protein
MTEPQINWYWEPTMIDLDERGFYWVPTRIGSHVCVVKCKAARMQAHWNVCRVMFDHHAPTETMQQTMDTLLDVCRMRYADELLNQGERK